MGPKSSSQDVEVIRAEKAGTRHATPRNTADLQDQQEEVREACDAVCHMCGQSGASGEAVCAHSVTAITDVLQGPFRYLAVMAGACPGQLRKTK